MATTPTAAFSISLDCRLDNVPGTLGRLCSAIGSAGGNIGALDGFDVRGPELRRNLVVHCRDEAHQLRVVDAVHALDGVTLVDQTVGPMGNEWSLIRNYVSPKGRRTVTVTADALDGTNHCRTTLSYKA